MDLTDRAITNFQADQAVIIGFVVILPLIIFTLYILIMILIELRRMNKK